MTDNTKAFPADHNWKQEGMDLRDYFAGKAMEAYVPLAQKLLADQKIRIDGFAVASYQWADAMMKARAQ